MLPLEKIKIEPLGAESLGIRSFCVYVETPDISILIDPSVALAPRRDGYPPHLREIAAAKFSRDLISERSKKSSILTISHYHFDHYTTSLNRIYQWTNEQHPLHIRRSLSNRRTSQVAPIRFANHQERFIGYHFINERQHKPQHTIRVRYPVYCLCLPHSWQVEVDTLPLVPSIL